jgi:DNA-binding transcriptional MocR family regulator
MSLAPPASDWIDLTINRPPSEGCNREVRDTFAALARQSDLLALLGNQPSAGRLEHRAAAADWIKTTGFVVQPEQVVICNGVQHGLAVTFGALSKPGDLVLTEELNYPGVRLLEKIYHLRLQGLPMDEQGIRPDMLEQACRTERARFLLCTPTVHNPTAAVMPAERRQKIADIAQRNGLVIVENDIYGFLPSQPILPISALVPETSFYITGTSKCLATGVRIGYVVVPSAALNDVITMVQATTWIAPSLMAEVVSQWIETRCTRKIIDWHRQEIAARQAIARKALSNYSFTSSPVSYHLWLQLPESWQGWDFASEALKRRVLITSGAAFTVGHTQPPNAVRIGLGGDCTRADIDMGLKILADTLSEGPRLEHIVM